MIDKTVKNTPRDRRRLKKIEEILGMATDLALQGGLEAVTIHGLAKALDYTPGALYRYFPSKADLLAALHVRLIDRLSTQIHTAWSATEAYSEAKQINEGDKSILQLMAVNIAVMHFAENEPGPFRIIGASFAHPRHMLDPSSAEGATEAYVNLINEISGHVATLQSNGQFRDGNIFHRAITLLLGTHTLLQLSKVSRLAPDLFESKQLSREFLTTLLRGWSDSPQALSSSLEQLSALEEHLSL